MPLTIDSRKQSIAILGGGPSGLFMYKRLIETGDPKLEIHIFERKTQLGSGMPYSTEGASDEHITNVSDNEIPQIVDTIAEWVTAAPKELLHRFDIDADRFNEYKVLPRLFFGEYMAAQFQLLRKMADNIGITTHVHLGKKVLDIIDDPIADQVRVEIEEMPLMDFDQVIICTGHNWPKRFEGTVPGYYDSPYPPKKLAMQANHPIAIRGSSLTAIDAIRTLSRHNGSFTCGLDDSLVYRPNKECPDFKMVIHSRNGMLPAVRFHLSDSHLTNDSLLTPAQIAEHIKNNDGFLSLDHVFEYDFKDVFRKKDAAFYERIKNMRIEEFVDSMMGLRERLDAFQLLQAEYTEAEKSIRRKESVYWKEMLGVLSFAMNYPAKYLSAEDMQRLQKVLMPLISIVIAYVPQSSCLELLALHKAGVLEIVAVGNDSEVETHPEGGITYHFTDADNHEHRDRYGTFVDCIGQPHMRYEDLPFKSLVSNKTVSPAKLRFRSATEGKAAAESGNKSVILDTDGEYYLRVPGIAINDNFQVVDAYGAFNPRIFIMAIPYIGGYNPDYSGLDFSEEASGRIVECIGAQERLVRNITLLGNTTKHG